MTSHPDLPTERARNLEYLSKMRATSAGAKPVSVARSRLWVDPNGIKGPSLRAVEPLIGRIGFDADDEALGRACYIGSRRVDEGTFQVVAWDAPLSQRLFYGRSDAECTVDGELAVRRTFEHNVDDISALDDEWLLNLESSPFEAKLTVPRPGTRPPTRRARTRRSAPASSRPPTTAPASLPGAQEERGASTAGMRAPEAVLRKLAASRSDALRSVLATLQPDQFDVVSRSKADDLIVQGHPGTGKTVIAAYRAAFLASPERRTARAGSVLLVGPTAKYVEHVAGLIRPLDVDGRVVVTHIAQVLERTVAIKGPWLGSIGGDHDDVDARAQAYASRAELRYQRDARRGTAETGRRAHIRALYELVRENGGSGSPLSNDPADQAWMRRLPVFDQAARLRRYLPFLAQLGLAIEAVASADQFDHIIVDEAQDISPIEWNVLEHYLGTGGRWTLIGDLNQRRSDTTYSSWSQVSDHLGLGHRDDALQPIVLARGYRSTVPILKFADRLLPAAQRGATSIQQDGPEPSVRYLPSASSLVPEAVAAACRLLADHQGGTVAIITVDPGAVIEWLGKHGWRRGDTATRWSLASFAVNVLAPEAARGLEFDGVVVVEPGAFPENLGRAGQLYTSLTRANHELEVVWHRDLPDALRKTGRP